MPTVPYPKRMGIGIPWYPNKVGMGTHLSAGWVSPNHPCIKKMTIIVPFISYPILKMEISNPKSRIRSTLQLIANPLDSRFKIHKTERKSPNLIISRHGFKIPDSETFSESWIWSCLQPIALNGHEIAMCWASRSNIIFKDRERTKKRTCKKGQNILLCKYQQNMEKGWAWGTITYHIENI